MKNILIVVFCVLIAVGIGLWYVLPTLNTTHTADPEPTKQYELLEYPFKSKHTLTKPPFDLNALTGTFVLHSEEGSSVRLFDIARKNEYLWKFDFAGRPVIEAAYKESDAAFVTHDDERYFLTIEKGDTSHTLTFENQLDEVVWSPDGTQLLYSEFVAKQLNESGVVIGGWVISSVDIASLFSESAQSPIQYIAHGKDPNFINNTEIVYLYQNDLYMKNILGGAPQLIADPEVPDTQTGDTMIDILNIPGLTISDDKTKLALTFPSEEIVYVVDVANGVPRDDSFFDAADTLIVSMFDPVFSPDGEYLALFDFIEGTVIYDLKSLEGWVVITNTNPDTNLTNPLFQWLNEAPAL